MSARGRIGWGHALTGLGLLIRRASAPLAVTALAAVVLTGAATGSAVAAPLWILALPVAAFLFARLLAVAVAAAGWMVFPPEHRMLLGEIAARPRDER